MAYAALADLYIYGAPEKAFGQLSDGTKTAALQAASDIVDSYYRGRFQLPLLAWDTATKEHTCRIAAYNLLNIRGYNPASGADVNILMRYEQSIKWLVLVQKQMAHPNVTPQVHETPKYNQPELISTSVVNTGTGQAKPSRGW